MMKLEARAARIIEFSGRWKRPPAGRTAALQSGVGNIANAVLAGLDDGPFRT
jgi:acyl-CoA hydrolase